MRGCELYSLPKIKLANRAAICQVNTFFYYYFRANGSIALRLNDFAIECNWDRLYIFDGDSVNAPLIASLRFHRRQIHLLQLIIFFCLCSGSLHSTNTTSSSDENCSGREFLATSGSALLYFYSDVLVTLSGFNITYR